MISNESIKNIISDLKNQDIEVRVRDISYVSLKHVFEDKYTAYKAIFGQEDDTFVIDDYDNSPMVSALSEYMQGNFFEKSDTDISFEENKAYLISLRDRTERLMSEKKIPYKEGMNILKDISIKLNDKFNVSEDVKESVVIVNHKYDDTCPYCHREIERRPISKEEAMEMYHLVERKEK